MLAEVKKCVESRDIKGLRYILLDSLDVDPTFEKYKEDYELCRNMDGLFENHHDLSGLTEDKSRWTQGYWEQLKTDLMKNFSEKRFNHMMQVAQVVYADKIARLVRERAEKQKTPKVVSQNISSALPKQADVISVETSALLTEDRGTALNAESEQQRIEAKRKALEEENRRIEVQQRAQRERIEAAKQADNLRNNRGTEEIKKGWGIALAIAIAAVLVVLIIMMLH